MGWDENGWRGPTGGCWSSIRHLVSRGVSRTHGLCSYVVCVQGQVLRLNYLRCACGMTTVYLLERVCGSKSQTSAVRPLLRTRRTTYLSRAMDVSSIIDVGTFDPIAHGGTLRATPFQSSRLDMAHFVCCRLLDVCMEAVVNWVEPLSVAQNSAADRSPPLPPCPTCLEWATA
ncbi:hypothetical protein LX32DRAFT_200515 [Colletotrichum zoysiae]|uniref:Uncharacterized protein n=1 Tax=Colletotrichum zoysiae TaxID=1216348 RepID=A0AAD9H697_9PEZI|nr:hypothetical protein LX32DRAFT_200515 [Colletotrichum zoysiae]